MDPRYPCDNLIMVLPVVMSWCASTRLKRERGPRLGQKNTSCWEDQGGHTNIRDGDDEEKAKQDFQRAKQCWKGAQAEPPEPPSDLCESPKSPNDTAVTPNDTKYLTSSCNTTWWHPHNNQITTNRSSFYILLWCHPSLRGPTPIKDDQYHLLECLQFH